MGNEIIKSMQVRFTMLYWTLGHFIVIYIFKIYIKCIIILHKQLIDFISCMSNVKYIIAFLNLLFYIFITVQNKCLLFSNQLTIGLTF